ncbi:MAG: hypothetical protein PHX45_06900 [Acidobacteriota bacterium]|nr:hypothetical protein [Acidobacteriota bacterium]
MTKQIMDRAAADNVYLHKDFHGALNQALIYVERVFGAAAVKDYLRQFAGTFHAPLRRAMSERGLDALKDYLADVYSDEGADIRIETIPCGREPDELTLHVKECPAVSHIRKMGLTVSPLFLETVKTVNEAICSGTPFDAGLLEYDPETGRSVQRFRRIAGRPR